MNSDLDNEILVKEISKYADFLELRRIFMVFMNIATTFLIFSLLFKLSNYFYLILGCISLASTSVVLILTFRMMLLLKKFKIYQ